jgi:hypothetical protein
MRFLLFAGAVIGRPAPSIQVSDDGTVNASAEVYADFETVKAALTSPADLHRIAGEVTIEETTADGECTLIRSLRSHPLATVRYWTRSCPTNDGYTETFVSSDDLADFSATLAVTPTDSGALVAYKFRTVTRFPTPDFIMKREASAEAQRMMQAVQAHFEE